MFVFNSGSRRTTDLPYSADRLPLAPLFAESGAACFTFGQLRDRVRQVFEAEGIRATVRRARIPHGTSLDDEDGRWTRYQAGCAVLSGGEPGLNRNTVAIELFVQR